MVIITYPCVIFGLILQEKHFLYVTTDYSINRINPRFCISVAYISLAIAVLIMIFAWRLMLG